MYPGYGYGYGWGGAGPWGAGAWGGPAWGGYPYGFDYTDLYDYNRDLVLEDNEIKDLVADTISADPYIPQSDVNAIRIDVRNGVVGLSGTVRNRRSKPLAYADAFWSRGVVDVNSDIVVEELGRRSEEAPPPTPRAGGRGY